jgi:Arc/MetJ-type ribon-helix-helix transcriptional regulator
MAYAFSPELQRKIEEHMSAGGYESEDELLLDAIDALEQSDEQLRAELTRRAKLAGTGVSQPLDLEKFLAERRQAHGLE